MWGYSKRFALGIYWKKFGRHRYVGKYLLFGWSLGRSKIIYTADWHKSMLWNGWNMSNWNWTDNMEAQPILPCLKLKPTLWRNSTYIQSDMNHRRLYVNLKKKFLSDVYSIVCHCISVVLTYSCLKSFHFPVQAWPVCGVLQAAVCGSYSHRRSDCFVRPRHLRLLLVHVLLQATSAGQEARPQRFRGQVLLWRGLGSPTIGEQGANWKAAVGDRCLSMFFKNCQLFVTVA